MLAANYKFEGLHVHQSVEVLIVYSGCMRCMVNNRTENISAGNIFISRVLHKEGKVMIFPEGMSSISGANQPVAIGTGKALDYIDKQEKIDTSFFSKRRKRY